MRIVRSKAFEDGSGQWQKVEIELSGDDLVREERDAPAATHPTLLELRAELFLIASLHRAGQMTEDEALDKSREVESLRRGIMGTPALRA